MNFPLLANYTQTPEDQSHLMKFVVYYRGNEFINMSAKTYTGIYTIFLDDADGSFVSIGWTWLVMLAAFPLVRYKRKR